MTFMDENPEDLRIKESNKILYKYPTRIPIIVEKYKDCKLKDIKKKKYLVPKNMEFKQFIYVIRKSIELESSQSLFITVNGKLVTGSKELGEIYEEDKNKDGFLYIVYTSENTFG